MLNGLGYYLRHSLGKTEERVFILSSKAISSKHLIEKTMPYVMVDNAPNIEEKTI